jgi:hypothetical protein
VLAKLEEWDTQMVPGARSEKQGPYHGKLTRFIQRLQSKVQDRRLGFLFGAGDDAMRYEWMEELAIALLGSTAILGDGGVKVIDFSEVPSDILPLMIWIRFTTPQPWLQYLSATWQFNQCSSTVVNCFSADHTL